MSELFRDEPAVKPVWQVIPRFFRYPFNGKVLPMLAIISLASVTTLIPVLGFFLWLLIWAMLFKISYEILSSTASGELDGPGAITQMSDGIMFKHIGLLIAMGLGYVFLVGFVGSPAFALVLGIFLLLALPAAMMTLAMTQSLAQALNPVMWIQIMRTTGASYLLTSVFLLMMLFSQSQAEAFLLPLFGGSMMLFLVVSTFISAYFMAASFHLMGYLLYQFHDEFGIAVREPGRSGQAAVHELPLIAEATAMVKAGQTDEAARFLGSEINRNGAEPEVHDYYRKLLHSRGESGALVEHGQVYVATLIHGFEDAGKALNVAEECLQIDKSFEPTNADDIRTLAQLAFDQGRHGLVLKLTSGFGRTHPKHHHVVDNYLLAARSMMEDPTRTDKAANLLRQLKKRFPDHPLAAEVARLEAGFSVGG